MHAADAARAIFLNAVADNFSRYIEIGTKRHRAKMPTAKTKTRLFFC